MQTEAISQVIRVKTREGDPMQTKAIKSCGWTHFRSQKGIQTEIWLGDTPQQSRHWHNNSAAVAQETILISAVACTFYLSLGGTFSSDSFTDEAFRTEMDSLETEEHMLVQ